MAPALIPSFATLEDVKKYLSDELAEQPDSRLQILFCKRGTTEDFKVFPPITNKKHIPLIAAAILAEQQHGTLVPHIL